MPIEQGKVVTLSCEPRGRFPEPLALGMQFEGVPGGGQPPRGQDSTDGGQPPRGQDSDDVRTYTVTDIAADQVVVDGNHPLAGERIWFSCSGKDVREATAEELGHGQPSGDRPLSARTR